MLTSGNTHLPLGGPVKFVQVSCAPFPSKLTEVATFRFPKSPHRVPNCRRRSRSESETADLAILIFMASTIAKSCCVVHYASPKNNDRASESNCRSSSMWLKSRILESCYQLIRESFTSAPESTCQFARRLTHFASREICREVHLPFCRGQHRSPTADTVEIGSPCVRRNGVHRSWSPVSTWPPTCSA